MAFGSGEGLTPLPLESDACRDVPDLTESCAVTTSVEGGGVRPVPRPEGGDAAPSVEDLVEDFGRPLLTVAEAAKRLNVSTSAIRTLCRRGLLPYGRVLNFIRLRPEDVDRFVGHDHSNFVVRLEKAKSCPSRGVRAPGRLVSEATAASSFRKRPGPL